MHVFPHRPTLTLANWRKAPFSRWAFHHVRELVPSADIRIDLGDARTFYTAMTERDWPHGGRFHYPAKHRPARLGY